MADNEDKDNKTEQPSEKRRTEALDRDGGPTSREVGSAVLLLLLSIFLSLDPSKLFLRLTQSLAVFIENPGNWRLDNAEDAVSVLKIAALIALNFIGVFVGAILIAGILAGWLQNSPRLMTNRILPDFSRISLSTGVGRLFSSQALVEFVKGLLKMAAAGFAAFTAIGGIHNGLRVIQSQPDAVPELLRQLCFHAVFICALLACLIATADVVFTRRSWLRNLMMSKQELKEEMKQTEGDVAFKARLRAITRSRIRRRMMANVPKATLVVTNPTHYAVALRYVRNEDAAPRVMAKGQDKLALTIREIAKSHNIPVIENKPLARSLYEVAEVDQLIPREFYKAVAELIIYLDSKSKASNRKRPSKPRASPRP